MKDLHAIVIGGGIGGLSAALALRRAGFGVDVYERAPEIREVGAGISFFSNAVRALRAAAPELADRLPSLGRDWRHALLGMPSGEFRSVDITADNPKQAPNYMITRSVLQRLLWDGLPGGIVQTGAECVAVEANGGAAEVRFADGRTARGDLVIGADRLHSAVRRELWGETPPVYCGQTCVRALADFHTGDLAGIAEIQGAGARFGVCPLSADRMYWFAAWNAPQNGSLSPEDLKADLQQRYAGWAFKIPAIIAATAPADILRNDLVDRDFLPRWSRGRATLLGDAAHPILPNLGQGACSAVEDGVVMARALRQASTLEGAFEAYELERKPRARKLLSKARDFGRFAAWSNPLAVGFRGFLWKHLPLSLLTREFAWQLEYEAGEIPGA